MAITREDFENIPSSGIISDDRLPASGFAVSYAFTYTGTPDPTNFNHTFTGHLRLHVLTALDTLKYQIDIFETFNLFIFPLAPGLVLYTWNWVPSAEKISGTIGDTPDAPPMTTLGEGSFGVEPAEGSGTSDFEVIIDSRFYSKIFTEPLESGDKIKIKFHNLSAGFVISRASLSLATELGAEGEGALVDVRTGSRWHLFLDKTLDLPSVKVVRSRQFRPVRTSTQMQFGQGVSVGETDNGLVEEDSRLAGLSLIRLKGGALVALGAVRSGVQMFRMFVSTDEGENWERVMNMDLGLTPLADCPVKNGSRILIYGLDAGKSPAYVVLGYGTVTDENGIESHGWRPIERGTPTSPIALPKTAPVSLHVGEGGVVRMLWRDTKSGTYNLLATNDSGKSYFAEVIS